MDKKIETLDSLKNVQEYLSFLDTRTLLKIQEYYADLYYNTADCTLDDDRYDLVKQEIDRRGQAEQPVVTVGAKIRTGENRVQLPFWLGSADKITPTEEKALLRWRDRNKAQKYTVTAKLDGVSCLMMRKNGSVHLYTRGDGRVGADISWLVPFFQGGKKLDQKQYDTHDIAVRGELIIRKDVFDSVYRKCAVDGKEYRNARNMVAGLVGAKTARKGLEHIDFVVYEIISTASTASTDTTPQPPSVQLETLEKMGFNVVRPRLSSIGEDQLSDVNALSELVFRFRDTCSYEIDGIIVQSDVSYDRNTSGNPSYLFAYKVPRPDTVYTATVDRVEWNVSKWGCLKPVAVIDPPVVLQDITITRVTAHNAAYVEQHRLGPGSKIKITRSKDVIPYIVEVVLTSAVKQIMPTVPYRWDDTHVNIYTEKTDDSTPRVKLVASFFHQLGIKHVSEATVTKMFENGLDSLIKILRADRERLKKVPGCQDKSAERIYTNIHTGLQNVKLAALVGASCVLGFGVGQRKVQALLSSIPDLFEKEWKSHELLQQEIERVEGFQTKTAHKIVHNMRGARMFLQEIRPFVTLYKENRVSASLAGQKFVMTGFRDKSLEERIVQRGGKVVGTVSKQTTALVIADADTNTTTTSSKQEKAVSLGIPICTVTEFTKKYLQ